MALCQIICVPVVICIAELCDMPRAMWAGIAAMSVILPLMDDMQYRVRKKNYWKYCRSDMLYSIIFPSSFTNICIYRCDWGNWVGFSTQYSWQAVFNTFGALAIATQLYGLKGK